MPCTTTVIGNLFLIWVYGYLMFVAAKYLSTGCELMLEILGPGVVGGLFLPILGALPDAMLILVSGLSGNLETAQDQVSVGMGLLAGSTVMLLTVKWGTCIIVGKCDLQDSFALDNQDTKGFTLVESIHSTKMTSKMLDPKKKKKTQRIQSPVQTVDQTCTFELTEENTQTILQTLLLDY
ncbi:hypothetical protein R6Q59_012933 [Mikania micrantha]